MLRSAVEKLRTLATRASVRRLRNGMEREGTRSLGPATGGTEAVESVSDATVAESTRALEERLAEVSGGKHRIPDHGKALVAAGRRAGEKLTAAGAGANLTRSELVAMEAIAIADGSRPPLLLKNDEVDLNGPAAGVWADRVRKLGAAVKAVSSGVGRVNAGTGHVGTGWMIRPGYIVTNRHVAQVLAKDPTARSLELSPLRKANVSFEYEGSRDDVRSHPIQAIAYAGEIHIDEYMTDFALLDLAILRVAPADGSELPAPLTSVLQPPTEITSGQDIYVFGYPGPASASMLPERTLLRLLGQETSVKRLSPGEVAVEIGGIDGDTSRRTIAHDATTLGGSSGSAIIAFGDLGDPRLVGLHFGGYEVRYGPGDDVDYVGRNFAHCFAAMPDVIRCVDAVVAAS